MSGISGHEEAEFIPSVRFRVEVCLPILDKLHAELKKRLQAYAKLSHKFGLLHNLFHLDAKQLKDGADNLVQQYPNDFEPSLAEELVSNCLRERSFSALKRIKNVLRSTMTNQKLIYL